MPGGMERDANDVNLGGFSVRERFDYRRVSHSGPQHSSPIASCQVLTAAPTCMIRMGMRHNRPVDRAPGIDMETARWTVKPSIG